MKVKAKAVHLVRTGLIVLFAATALISVSSLVVNAQSSRRAEVQERIQQKRQEVLERQEARREERGEKRVEQRVAACERNSTKLERSMERLTGQAERHLSVISSFQTKVEEFYGSGQLTVENYDELLVAVVEAKEKATNNVEAISEVQIDIDCEDSQVATSVGLYRVIANDTRNTLKDYRNSLVDLISAMRSEAAETSEDGSTDDESEAEDEQETEEEIDSDDSTDDSEGEGSQS